VYFGVLYIDYEAFPIRNIHFTTETLNNPKILLEQVGSDYGGSTVITHYLIPRP